MYKLVIAVVVVALFEGALGHGMVMDPPNRSSMWRFDPEAPPNYEDDQNYCGGMTIQWQENGGKCGMCGDDYRDKQPRANENTGTYGLGEIGKTYKSGQVIEVNVLLTTNHWGYFNFSLCKIEDPTKPETEDCFQWLKLADGSDKYHLPSHEDGYYRVNVKLPDGLTCKQCSLRWNYNTGNNWGQCEDGHWDEGCGPQETFRSCSDIAIE